MMNMYIFPRDSKQGIYLFSFCIDHMLYKKKAVSKKKKKKSNFK